MKCFCYVHCDISGHKGISIVKNRTIVNLLFFRSVHIEIGQNSDCMDLSSLSMSDKTNCVEKLLNKNPSYANFSIKLYLYFYDNNCGSESQWMQRCDQLRRPNARKYTWIESIGPTVTVAVWRERGPYTSANSISRRTFCFIFLFS